MFKRNLLVLSILCALTIVSVPVFAVDADSVLGVWQVESQADDATQVTIYKCGDKYCGKISWLKDPETLDTKNPDESKRSQKLLGMDFISNFEFDDDEWGDGKIYDARSGKTYDCKMWYKDKTQDVLNVKGYVLFIGKTSIFYRMK
jgi:uncharacterized protein (DUF2147 family)